MEFSTRKRPKKLFKIKFADELASLILTGEKYTTWRINDDKNLSKGDILSLCRRRDGSEFAKAKITSVKETTFERLTEEDKTGHEKFSSDEEIYQTYSKYYKRKIGPKTKLKVIKFQLLLENFRKKFDKLAEKR